MKRYLLLTMLCVLAAVGVKADFNIIATTIDGKTAYGIYGVSNSDEGGASTMQPGDLKALLDGNYKGNVNWNGASLDALLSADGLKIGSGSEQLNSGDLASLTKCSAIIIDMDKALLAENTSVLSMSSNAEYISLPYNTPISDMKGMKTNNPNLKAVACTNGTATDIEFTGYSWAAGEIYNICQKQIVSKGQDNLSVGVCTNAMKKLTIGGVVDDRDASTLARTGNNESKNWSFFNHTGRFYEKNGEKIDCAGGYIEPSHPGFGCSPWEGGTNIEIDFSEAIFHNLGDLALVSQNVKKMSLPNNDSFTSIPPYMFADLMQLEEIVVPNSVITIGDAAFSVSGTGSMCTNVTIGNGIKTIGNAVFANREAITDFRFAAGISNVKLLASVFTGCNGIKHLTLPEGVVSIGEACCRQLVSLESVHFPSTLEYIGKNCFTQTGLTTLTIPASMKIIDMNAFGNCRITDIYLMAKTLDELPYIYASGFGSLSNENFATFGSNSISGNNSSPGKDEKTGFLECQTKEESEEKYRRSIKDGNTISCLHFNESLRSFIDYNPWYVEGVAKPVSNSIGNYGAMEKLYLPDTYYFKDALGNTYPECVDADYVRANYAAYFSQSEGPYTWDGVQGSGTLTAATGSAFNITDGSAYQTTYYNPETGELIEFSPVTNYIYKVLAKEGWRQFVFKEGDAGNEDVVFDKEYDNIWYTMCFPFSLTDEQLETAFNAEYNIADFSAVEIRTDEETAQKSLVLHFNKIAKAKYFDLDNNEYTRKQTADGKDEIIVVRVGFTDFNTYIYLDADGNEYKYVTTYSNKSYAKDGDSKNGIHYIDGYLAQAGHPYMIHPNFGTSKGDKALTAHLVGINYYSKDAGVIEQLCEERARTVELGQAKTYTGSHTNASTLQEFTENFNQQAYGSDYDNQMYTFIGNCSEYAEDADPKPTKAAYPDEPTYLIKLIAPTKVDNPYPGLVDPATKYSERFVEFYNKEKGDVWAQNENGDWYSFKQSWGDYLAGKESINQEFNYYNEAKQGWAYWEDKANDLTDYMGGVYVSESKFNELLSLCKSYPSDIAAYQEAMASTSYQEYLTYLSALSSYETALAAYMEEHPDATADDIAAYNTSVDETNDDLRQGWENDKKDIDDDYDNALAAWESNVKAYYKYIPQNAYFLSRLSTEYYTRFFRETASEAKRKTTGKGRWSQYSAVVIPNTDALSGIEAELDAQEASAKGYSMAFDQDYAVVLPTSIKQIIADAEEKGQKVEYMDVVVSIDGKIVKRGDITLEGLPRGLYIVNGKKYFVK